MIRAEGHLGGYVEDDIEYRTYCPEVWDWLIDSCKVRSALDIGCGLGHTIKYFQSYGCDVLEIDGSISAIEDNEEYKLPLECEIFKQEALSQI